MQVSYFFLSSVKIHRINYFSNIFNHFVDYQNICSMFTSPITEAC